MTVDFHSVFEHELKAINFRREHLNEGTAPSQGKDPALKQAGTRAKRFLVDRAMASIVSPPSGKTRGPTKTAPESKLTGLAFSGGGMRSASFCLGVLQGLDAVAPEGQPQVLDAFDYLSTVSGGGYIGASLVAALMQGDHSFPFESRLDEQETPEIQHLRDHSNFLAPNGLIDLVTGFALVLRGLLVNAVTILPLLLICAAFTIFCNPTLADLKQPDVLGIPISDVLPFNLPAFGQFTLSVWLAGLFMFLTFASAIWSSLTFARGSLDRREAMGRFLGALLLVWLAVVFIEVQPFVIRGIIEAGKPPGDPKSTDPVQQALVVIGHVIPGLTAVLGPLAVILISTGQKLANVAKATIGEANLKSVLAKRGSELALWGAALIVPFILWAVYLYLSVWGIHGSPGDASCLKENTPAWLEGLTSCLNGALPQPIARLGTVGYDYAFLAAALFLICLLLGPNANSLHELYRDRLSRAFLFDRAKLIAEERTTEANQTASATARSHPAELDEDLDTNPQSIDGRKLSSLKPKKKDGSFKRAAAAAPYILMNASINLQGSKELNKRGRNADTFLFSPLFVGSRCTGFTATTEIEEFAPNFGLATAIAISGAAASANMGRETIKVLTFSLAMLNVRLGYWLFNPSRLKDLKRFWPSGWSNFGTLFFVKEATGNLSNNDLNVYLTDGGHVENLGIYELLRRRCKVVVAVDMDMDPNLTFPSLVNLEVMARIDLGVRLDLPWAKLQESAVAVTAEKLRGKEGFPGGKGPHACVGRILYDDDDEPGVIIFIKSCLSGDENDYVLDYKRRNETFPHETTLDQFFTEEQFEAYRSLGFHSVQRLFTGQDTFETLVEPAAGWKTQLTAALRLLNIPTDCISDIIGHCPPADRSATIVTG